jgi:hypothetical protein
MSYLRRQKSRFLIIFFALLATSVDVVAQDIPPPGRTPSNVPSRTGDLLGFFTARTPYEFWLTCLIIFWGLVMITSLIILSRKIPNKRMEDVARPIIVISVVVSAMILATAGYANEQIAAAYGLFGSIIGYVFGRLSRTDRDDRDQAGSSPRFETTGAPSGATTS